MRAWDARLLFLACALVLAPACRHHTPAPAQKASLADGLKWADAPIDWSRPLPKTPPGGLAEAGYVGSAACRACHPKVYDQYQRHSMARTGLRPLASLDARWLGKIFDIGAKTPILQQRSGYTYRPFRKDGRYFIEESKLAPDGTRVQDRTVEITLALSAGSYGLAFYFRQGSRIYHAPLDYYARLARWDLDPIAFRGNPRFSASLGMFCISCHGDYPLRRAGTDHVFLDPLPTGIGCERCHGPGREHVASLDGKDIVNPAKLPPLRQLDLCSQCHQSSFPVLRAGRSQFSYRPGQPLDAFRVDFVSADAEPDRFNLLAHSERLVRSRCFRASGGKLTCTSCHDPHASSLDEPVSYWDQKCEACHHDHPCTAPASLRATEGDHCPRCHMRMGPTANVPLVSVTDHFIQKRPPPIRPGRLPAPAHLVAWSRFTGDPAAPGGADLPAVEAVAWADAGRPEIAERLAAQVIDRRPAVPKLYEWLAERLGRRASPALAKRALAGLLQIDPDSRLGLLGYARASLGAGGPEAVVAAGRALDRLLALDPKNPEALETRGMLLFRGGNLGAARSLFERAAAAGPATARAHVALAVLDAKSGHAAEAIAELEAARQIQPDDAWILDRLDAAYQTAHDAAHAQEIDRVRQALAASGHPPAITSATGWLPPTWR